MRISETTKTFKLFTALQNGEAITPAAAEKRFGIGKPSRKLVAAGYKAMALGLA